MIQMQPVWRKVAALLFVLALVPFSIAAAQSDDTTAQEEANKELVREALGAFLNPELTEQYISPDFIEHEMMPMEGMTDAESLAAATEMMSSAITDFEFVIIDMIAEGDKVAVIGAWTGTHSGDMMGMPATGNEFEIPVFDLFRVEDGLIVEHWGVTDNLAFGMAFGMIPPMEEGM